MGKLIDLTGQRFGKLVIIQRAEDHIKPSGQRSTMWLCRCDCGNNTTIRGSDLKSGKTRSCGCLHYENVEKYGCKNKKYNKYNLSGEYGIGYTFKDEEFYFDLEDYDKIKNTCWHINEKGYVIGIYNGNRIMFHRLVMDAPDNLDVDHKHGSNSRNDNRKCNLRIATRSQNNMNKDITKRNKTGVVGVSWTSTFNKWIANIMINEKNIHLGYFINFEDAVLARKAAEEKYFGEFSYDNSIKDELNY